MRRSSVLAACCVVVLGCGNGNGSGTSSASSGPSGIAATFVLPLLVTGNVYASRGLLVEAVYAATAQSGAALIGGVAKTGTLTVGAAGTTYAAAPTDRLVVELGSTRHEFVLQEVQGNAQAPDAATWTASPHVLKYRHSIKDEAEADVSVRFDGANFEVGVKGWTKVGERRYDFDLAARGGVGGERDLGGQDTTTRATLTGVLRGDGFEADVREEHVRRFVSAQSLDLLYSQRGWSSQTQTRSASVVRSGGVAYQFQDVDTRSDMTEKGGRVTNQATSAGGSVLGGGARFGEILFDGGAATLRTVAGDFPLRL